MQLSTVTRLLLPAPTFPCDSPAPRHHAAQPARPSHPTAAGLKLFSCNHPYGGVFFAGDHSVSLVTHTGCVTMLSAAGALQLFCWYSGNASALFFLFTI